MGISKKQATDPALLMGILCIGKLVARRALSPTFTQKMDLAFDIGSHFGTLECGK
jgi:hypothetical protein